MRLHGSPGVSGAFWGFPSAHAAPCRKTLIDRDFCGTSVHALGRCDGGTGVIGTVPAGQYSKHATHAARSRLARLAAMANSQSSHLKTVRNRMVLKHMKMMIYGILLYSSAYTCRAPTGFVSSDFTGLFTVDRYRSRSRPTSRNLPPLLFSGPQHWTQRAW